MFTAVSLELIPLFLVILLDFYQLESIQQQTNATVELLNTSNRINAPTMFEAVRFNYTHRHTKMTHTDTHIQTHTVTIPEVENIQDHCLVLIIILICGRSRPSTNQRSAPFYLWFLGFFTNLFRCFFYNVMVPFLSSTPTRHTPPPLSEKLDLP